SGRKCRTNELIRAFLTGFTRQRASRWTCRERKCCGSRCCIATNRRARSVGESRSVPGASMPGSGCSPQLRRHTMQGDRQLPYVEGWGEHADFPGARIEQQNGHRMIEVVPAARQVDARDADPERAGEAPDLGGIAGEAEEARVELTQISGEHRRGIPLRVHRDEEYLQARQGRRALHLCELGKRVRALVGTMRESEVDEGRMTHQGR